MIALEALVLRQERRYKRYGPEAAEEWPISRTPGKLRRAYRARAKALTRARLQLQEECDSDVESLLFEAYGPSPASTASVRSPYRVPLPPQSEGSSQSRRQSDTGSPPKRTAEQMEEANNRASRTERKAKRLRVDVAPEQSNPVRDRTFLGENGHGVELGREDQDISPADHDVHAAGLENTRQPP